MNRWTTARRAFHEPHQHLLDEAEAGREEKGVGRRKVSGTEHMTAIIVSKLVGDAVEALRQAVERPLGQALTAREVVDAQALCMTILDLFRRERDALNTMLNEGVEATAFRSVCEPAMAAAGSHLTVQRQVETLLRSGAGGVPPDVAGATQLAEAAAQIEAFRREFQTVIDLVSRPRKPIDEKKLDELCAAHPVGSGETVEDILARLEAGGEL